MLEWYRELIRLRRETPALNAAEPGQTLVSYDELGKTFVMMRGPMMLCCNLGKGEYRFDLPENCKVVLSSRAGVALTEATLLLAPNTAVVLNKSEARITA